MYIAEHTSSSVGHPERSGRVDKIVHLTIWWSRMCWPLRASQRASPVSWYPETPPIDLRLDVTVGGGHLSVVR